MPVSISAANRSNDPPRRLSPIFLGNLPSKNLERPSGQLRLKVDQLGKHVDDLAKIEVSKAGLTCTLCDPMLKLIEQSLGRSKTARAIDRTDARIVDAVAP
jgi:hypothetical protein